MLRQGRSICGGSLASRVVFPTGTRRNPCQGQQQHHVSYLLLFRAFGLMATDWDPCKWSHRGVNPHPQPQIQYDLTLHRFSCPADHRRRFFATTFSSTRALGGPEDRRLGRRRYERTGEREYRKRSGVSQERSNRPRHAASGERWQQRQQRPAYEEMDDRSYRQQRSDETVERRFGQRSDTRDERGKRQQKHEEEDERGFRERPEASDERTHRPRSVWMEKQQKYRPRVDARDGRMDGQSFEGKEERRYRSSATTTGRGSMARVTAFDQEEDKKHERRSRQRLEAPDERVHRPRSGGMEKQRYQQRVDASNGRIHGRSSDGREERRYRTRGATPGRGPMARVTAFDEEDDEESENAVPSGSARYSQQKQQVRSRRKKGNMAAFDEEVDFEPENAVSSGTMRYSRKPQPEMSARKKYSTKRFPKENENYTAKTSGQDESDEQKQQSGTKYVKRGGSFYPENVVVVCHPGLERVLSSELTCLGIRHRSVSATTNGLIRLDPPISIETILKLHMYLGSASHVMLELLSGESHHSARALGEIQRKVQRVAWQDILQFPFLNYKQKRRQLFEERKKRGSENNANAKVDDPPSSFIYIKMKVSATKSRILHTGAISERIINAINENLKEGKDWKGEKVVLYKESEHEGNIPRQPIISLEARMHYDRLRLWLNTSSLTVPLNRRGYRLAVAKAPLREDLAYAMLYNAGWVPRYDAARESITDASYDPDGSSSDEEESLPYSERAASSSSDVDSESDDENATISFDGFLDPFCGSGTLAIEAASMWAGLPPGRLRPPPLAGTQWHEPTLWQTMLDWAMSHVRHQGIMIACSDRDKGAMEAVESNAKRAGVWHLLTPWEGAFSGHKWLLSSKDKKDNENFPQNLMIATNPPYGERLVLSKHKGSRHEQLLPMFQTLGSRLENFGNSPTSSYTVAVLVHDKNIIKRACGGFDWEDNLSFSNGNIFVTSMLTRSQNNKDAGGIPLKVTAIAEEEQVETAPFKSQPLQEELLKEGVATVEEEETKMETAPLRGDSQQEGLLKESVAVESQETEQRLTV